MSDGMPVIERDHNGERGAMAWTAHAGFHINKLADELLDSIFAQARKQARHAR